MKKKSNKSTKFLRNIILTFISLAIIVIILKIAPDYTRNDIKDRTNLIINNNNITANLKNDLYISENEVIYISLRDAKNFFDSTIYFDEEEKHVITTSDTKVALLEINNKTIEVNSAEFEIMEPAKLVEKIVYIPISELNEVYNVEVIYLPEQDRVLIDSLDRECIKADANKSVSVKVKAKTLSRTVDKIKKGEKITVISQPEDGWTKIRTARGKIGYIKEKNISNKYKIRENMNEQDKLETVSLVWDYYSEYVSAPDRTGTTINGINVVSPSFFSLKKLGKGDIIDKVGTSGKKYIEWAHSKNYEVWAMFSNESMIQTTGEIMKDYRLREKTINNIVSLAVKYKLDGINVDFENMYMEDKELFSRFIIELYPRLKECGICLSIDVTAPDGSDTWSKCFDRHTLAKNCDYLIFMAYDQYGQSDTKAGTTAGYDWIERSVQKFIGTQEEVDPSKLILGIPFYTRVWKEDSNGKATSSVVNMENIESTLQKTFSGAQKVWDDVLKQNYVEKKSGSYTYKMWIEDADSIRAKLNLAKTKNLAGVAFWEYGREAAGTWNLVQNIMFDK